MAPVGGGDIPYQPGMKTHTGNIDYNLAAAIGYVIPLLAIVIAFTEPKEPQRRWIRFHALQAAFFSIGASVVLSVLAQILVRIAGVLGLLVTLAWLGYLVVAIMAAMKAHKGETMRLPFLADQAAQRA